MTPAQYYRTVAAELRAMAACAESGPLAVQWEQLASCYLRLAEQADKNGQLDLSLEFGDAPRVDDDGPPPQ
jgi:hypothetical protein